MQIYNTEDAGYLAGSTRADDSRSGGHCKGCGVSCKYARDYYGVDACIGRIVECSGVRGIIAEDRGHYLGVNFDRDKPGVIFNIHPTHEVTYLGMGKVRKMTRSQQRYKRYLEWADCFDSFIAFCQWDAEPERSWNGGAA